MVQGNNREDGDWLNSKITERRILQQGGVIGAAHLIGGVLIGSAQ